MNRADFMKYMQQMGNLYGTKVNDDQMKIWYENLKFMSLERFNYILSEIYQTSPYMPKLADILQKHKEIPYKPKEDVDNREDCKKCNNTGVILYTKEIDGKPYTYACACTCGRASYDGRKMKDEKLKSDFYLATAEELGFENESNKPNREEVIASMIKVRDSGIVPESIKEIVRRKLKEGY